MRIMYGENDDKTQVEKLRYLQRKGYTQRLICMTMHEYNSMVIRKLNED